MYSSWATVISRGVEDLLVQRNRKEAGVLLIVVRKPSSPTLRGDSDLMKIAQKDHRVDELVVAGCTISTFVLVQ